MNIAKKKVSDLFNLKINLKIIIVVASFLCGLRDVVRNLKNGAELQVAVAHIRMDTLGSLAKSVIVC